MVEADGDLILLKNLIGSLQAENQLHREVGGLSEDISCALALVGRLAKMRPIRSNMSKYFRGPERSEVQALLFLFISQLNQIPL